MSLPRFSPLILAFALAAPATAAPKFLLYQGRHLNAGSPSNGTVSMEFRVTDGTALACGTAANGTTLFWTSGAQNVVTSSGVFSYKVGLQADQASQDAAFTSIDWSAAGAKYLSLCVAGTALTPQEPIGSSVYALYASSAGYVAPGALDSSSVTLQGNNFNAANKLVKLDGTGRLPAVDGSQLTNLPGATALLASTSTWSAKQTYNNTVTISSHLVVSGRITGDGTGLTAVPYASLTGAPALAAVAVSADYSDLINRPTLYTDADAIAAVTPSLGNMPTAASAPATCDAAARGRFYFDTTQLQHYGCNGSAWQAVASGGSPTSLLSSTNTWSATQVFASSVNFSTTVIAQGTISVYQSPADGWGYQVVNVNYLNNKLTNYPTNASAAAAFASSAHNHDGVYSAAAHDHDGSYPSIANAGMLNSTKTWSAHQTFASSITASNLTVTGGGDITVPAVAFSAQGVVTDINALETDINTLETTASALDTRVDALETGKTTKVTATHTAVANSSVVSLVDGTAALDRTATVWTKCGAATSWTESTGNANFITAMTSDGTTISVQNTSGSTCDIRIVSIR